MFQEIGGAKLAENLVTLPSRWKLCLHQLITMPGFINYADLVQRSFVNNNEM